MSFASPDIDEPLQVDHYVLKHAGRAAAELPELVPDEVLAVLATCRTTDPLNDVHVLTYDASPNRPYEPHKPAPVCLP